MTAVSVAPDAFRGQPVLHGERIRLEPLRLEHFEGVFAMLSNPEGLRMTATTRVFEEDFARQWVSTRQDHHDRADYAIVRAEDDLVLGEVVLNDLDPEHAVVNFRIGLRGPEVFGQGYGTEATSLLLDYAFGEVGLHRVELEVYDYNPRARRSYEKCGFVLEGVRRQALWWEGAWHDVLIMAVLSTDPRPERSGVR